MTDGIDDDALRTGGAFGVLAGLDAGATDPVLGRTLGDYEILELIAAGGMGRVYRARRADGSFEREVAVKVSPASGFSKELQSRFVQEQDVLAGLNHANVCQLYDANVTEEGWPYIVMELIDGQSIVDHCEHNALDARQRLRLLVNVVDAVAYAHSRLVVHRDIKPANVLVSRVGHVKLLDFGIAKLLESEQALTQAAPLTPRYASPEQLLGQPITVASDISQLGLLIYEVLTGDALNASETLADAIQRASDGQSLRVDLDRSEAIPQEVLPIIEQCLRADPADRYPDANSLKADLQAFLDGFPVKAAGLSAGYRFRKLLSRNLPTTVTATVALVAIISGVTWYTWQLGVARDSAERQAAAARLEAEKSEQISNFLIELFSSEDPANALGEEVTIQKVLESGVAKIRSELSGQESLQADLLMTLGGVYRQLDKPEKAGPLLEEAIELHRKAESDDPTALATALFRYGEHISMLSDLDAMVVAFEEALAVAKQTDTDEGRKVEAFVLNSLGIVFSRRNEFERSEATYKEAIDVHTAVFGADHVETSVPKANYALLLTKLKRNDEALPLLESAYTTAVEVHGPYHPWIAPRAINLATQYKLHERFTEAEELFRVALEQDRYLYGDEHQYVASSLQNLGTFVYENREKEEGIRLIEEGLKIEEKTLGDDHIYTNQSRSHLAHYYNETNRHEEAEHLLNQAKAHFEVIFDGDHDYPMRMNRYFGELYLATGRSEQAVEVLEQSLQMCERLYGGESVNLEPILAELADAYGAVGRHRAAYTAYERLVRLAEASGDANSEHYRTLELLGQATGGQSDRAGEGVN